MTANYQNRVQVTSLLPSVRGEIIAVQAVAFVFEVAALVLLWSPRSGNVPARRIEGKPASRVR
jgi:hypothetical protein